MSDRELPLQTRETRPKYQSYLRELREFLERSGSIREVLLGVGEHLLRLLDAERATMYAIDKQTHELYSLLRTDGEPTEIRLSQGTESLAGYCAMTRRALSVRDAYDTRELSRVSAELRHDARWDALLGIRTRQVLCVPLVVEPWLLGVLQFINSRDGADFQRDDEVLAEEIALALGSTFYKHFRRPSSRPPPKGSSSPVVIPAPARLPSLSAQPLPHSPVVSSVRPQGSARPRASSGRPATAPDELSRLVQALESVALSEAPLRHHDHDEELTEVQSSDALIARLVRQIVHDARVKGASDVHIEPNGPNVLCRVRVRVDGECSDLVSLPAAHRVALVQRIKILAELDISERRRPQDGKFRVEGAAGTVEVRVATIPTVGDNEDVTLRLLSAWQPMPLTGLSLTEANLDVLRGLLKSPYGIILVVGPTGSGKTTTLHAALGHLNTADTKILTVEDPVEIVQPGLRQAQVNLRAGVGYPEMLRAFLRGDPDVIMVGEMRDEVTAKIGVESALTGHLVFSTLQSNSAPETITRLLGMNIDPVSFADALRGVIAQRLVRRLCEGCKESYTAMPEEYKSLGDDYGFARFSSRFSDPSEVTLHRARGCAACLGTGYKGRLPIHEIMAGSDDIKRLIRTRATVDVVRETAAREGMQSLMQDGITKVLWGLTDHAQVRAACID